MAYDPVKAHEYYENYTKKGKKKGRKKSTKKAKTQSLAGVSTTAGLNSDGAVEATLIKDNLKKEMNAALAGAKTEEEKTAIRREYSQRANAEIAKLKADPRYAKAKSTPTKSLSSKSSSKSTSTKSIGTGNRSKSTKGITVTSRTGTISRTSAMQQNIENLNNMVADLTEKIALMTEEQKTLAKSLLTDIVDRLRKQNLEE